MNKFKNRKKSFPKKPSSFKPNSNYIKNATEDYLNKGGRITKLDKQSGYYSGMTNTSKYQDAFSGKIF